MSQKFSLPQDAKSASQALMPDNDDYTRSLVGEKYREDVEFFGYSF